jgi:GTP cyclohydrolase I
MDNQAPPVAPKPKSILASRILNGQPSASTPSVSPQERRRLAASIEASHSERQPIDLDATEPQHNGGESHLNRALPSRPKVQSRLSVAPRDSRDVEKWHGEKRGDGDGVRSPPAESRPASPYTMNPPIDFDGLSWPSKHSQDALRRTTPAARSYDRSHTKQIHRQVLAPANASKQHPKKLRLA